MTLSSCRIACLNLARRCDVGVVLTVVSTYLHLSLVPCYFESWLFCGTCLPWKGLARQRSCLALFLHQINKHQTNIALPILNICFGGPGHLHVLKRMFLSMQASSVEPFSISHIIGFFTQISFCSCFHSWVYLEGFQSIFNKVRCIQCMPGYTWVVCSITHCWESAWRGISQQFMLIKE